jgi:hypothetical protein
MLEDKPPARKHHRAKDIADREVRRAACARPAGVVKLGNRDVAVGYRPGGRAPAGVGASPPETVPAWSQPGQLRGLAWLHVSTDAPAEVVAVRLRCLGPLVVLASAWDDLQEEGRGGGGRAPAAAQEPGAAAGRGEERAPSLLGGHARAIRERLGRRPREYAEAFRRALDAWLECALASWDLSPPEQRELARKVRGSGHGNDDDGGGGSAAPLLYRLSCLREDSKSYPYSRQQLLNEVAGAVLPDPSLLPGSERWRVDLTRYDLEVVLLLRPQAVAIGLAARPYRRLAAKSFGSGAVPPDVSPPYLSGGVFSGLVRLRPSTAQLLLRLARPGPGDVVLDPCAGIGTVPAEALFAGAAPAVAIGGDLVLHPELLGSVAAGYLSQGRDCHRRWHPGARSTAVELLGADASWLPFRDEVVDAIVSDLPFGQMCLSSAKLDGLIPLLVSEAARVLRRSSGRMVLLCGSYATVLSALLDENSRARQKIWDLPCEAVFPVNIGGFLGWIVQVNRGCDVPVRIANHRERVSKITEKRAIASKSRPDRGRATRLQA